MEDGGDAYIARRFTRTGTPLQFAGQKSARTNLQRALPSGPRIVRSLVEAAGWY